MLFGGGESLLRTLLVGILAYVAPVAFLWLSGSSASSLTEVKGDAG
jgi:hypothetical protein